MVYCIYVLVCVCFVYSFVQVESSDLWSRLHVRRSADRTAEKASTISEYIVNFEPDLPNEICALDSLSIEFTMAHKVPLSLTYDQFLLYVEHEQTGAAMVRHLQEDGPMQERDMQMNTSAAISCAINSDDCIPQVVSISIRDPNQLPRRLSVTFDVDTITTEFPNAASLLKALTFTPFLTGLAEGSWVSPTQLEITVDEQYYTDIISAYQEKRPISVATRVISPATRMEMIRFRPSMEWTGRLLIYVANATSRDVISRVHSVNVKDCRDFILPATGSASAVADDRALPTAVFRMGGIISLNGINSVVIPNNMIHRDEWTLSMWLFLAETTYSQHRTLFYKGDSNSSRGRTPSVWLLPDSKKMVLQASSEENLAISTNNIVDVQKMTWQLLTFVFTNYSALEDAYPNAGDEPDRKEALLQGYEIISSAAGSISNSKIQNSKSYNYSIQIYHNDVSDISVGYPMLIFGNDSPLTLFKDNSHQGPFGFASGVTIWNGALSADEVASMNSVGPPKGCDSISEAIELLDHNAVDTNPEKNSVLSRLIHPEFGVFSDVSVNTRRLIASPYSGTNECSIEDDNNNCDIVNDELVTSEEDLPIDQISQLYPIPLIFDYDADKVLMERLAIRSGQAYSECKRGATRLDNYRQLALESGEVSTHALYKWALLNSFGSEAADSKCGINGVMKWVSGGDFDQSDLAPVRRKHVQTFRALINAAALGRAQALPVIATFLLSGISAVDEFVHLATASFDCDICTGFRSCSFELSFACHLKFLLKSCESNRKTKLTTNNRSTTSVLRIGDSALCYQYLSSAKLKRRSWDTDPVSRFAIALLHVAAMSGGGVELTAEASMSLLYRYQHGIGVPKDLETASFYAMSAASTSSDAYHAVGGMPVVEADRLNDYTERTVEEGNKGGDDELIQLEIVRAAEGNVPSMLSMGDINYFGSRGVPRNQPEALRYYNQAAAAQNTHGMCCAAAMYLKGEGMDAGNTSKALELYTDAAERGSVKALNGLGYIYFYGQGGLAQNYTKAFEYFLNATTFDTDADSWFNAAYMLQNGLGIDADQEKAANMYKHSVTQFGHFGSTFELGKMYLQGTGVARSTVDSLHHLGPISSMGPWVGWIRRGLDAYLSGDHAAAALCYAHAAEIGGYELAYSNVAYMVRRRMSPKKSFINHAVSLLPQLISNEIAAKPVGGAEDELSVGVFHQSSLLRFLVLAANGGSVEAMSSAADVFLSGKYLPFDSVSGSERAVQWYSKASARGSVYSSFQLGVLSQFGIGGAPDMQRAEVYYSDALKKGSVTSTAVVSNNGQTSSANSYPVVVFATAMRYFANIAQSHSWLSPINNLLNITVRYFYL